MRRLMPLKEEEKKASPFKLLTSSRAQLTSTKRPDEEEKISGAKQETAKRKSTSICVICINSIESKSKATIDSCSHAFCLSCIKTWGTTQANLCPLCKIRFNTVSYTENGVSKVLKMADRDEGEINPSSSGCIFCRNRSVE